MVACRVYLAGPISDVSYEEATKWREEAVKILGGHSIKALNPMKDKSYPYNYTDEQIATRDYEDLRRSDVILAYLPEGVKIVDTYVEIGFAHGIGLEIILVGEATSHLTRYVAAEQFNNLEDAYRYLISKYGW